MKTKNLFLYSLLLAFGLLLINCENPDEPTPQGQPKVLIFSKTAGFRHGNIETGIQAIKKLGQENDFTVVATEDADRLNDDSLQYYVVIIFLNTTGDILNAQQQIAMENFIRSGKGFVGIHSATDTEYDWAWYGELVGAYFNGHPAIQEAKLPVKIRDHISTRHLPAVWERRDEWYNFKNIQNDIKVLIEIDEASYQGGTHDKNHPIAWYREFDGGRSFYTAGGHTNESFSEPDFLQHIHGGILYAMGGK